MDDWVTGNIKSYTLKLDDGVTGSLYDKAGL